MLAHLRLMQPEDFDAALACHRRFAARNHGMVEKFDEEIRGARGDIQVRRLGWYDGGVLRGYAAYRFESASDSNYTQNRLSVEELVYEDGAILRGLLGGLNMQADLAQTVILRTGEDADCCWYDMTYEPQAVGMFRYLHSNPVEKSAAVLHQVLDTLEEKLYRPTAAAADPQKIEQYIAAKVDGNLQKLREARSLHELMEYPTAWINGKEYKNLNQLGWLFDHARLQALFADDPVATIHGDLTIENIICRTDDTGWYLIDPNTGNLHESPFLDYGKLLQSLHGGYEFMMMTPRVTVQGNHIDFALTRSAAYDGLFTDLMAELGKRYPDQLDSILMHEVVHWLRLMPYKLSKDRKRAPMFYAGLVMVANYAALHAQR